MLPILGGIISAIGNIFGGIFQTKQAKMEAVAQGVAGIVSLLKEANASDAQIAAAVSAAVVADSQSESILARNWRPICMLLIVTAVIAFFFGYQPPHLNDPMSPMMDKLFDMLQYGLMGFIPARSLEKITKMIMTPKVIETLLSKLK